MKTLNEQYNLIKEGKGPKDVFLKEAKTLYPQYIRSGAGFEEASKILKDKGVINESLVAVNSPFLKKEKPAYQTKFEQYLQESEVKAEEKKTSKEVEDNQDKVHDAEDDLDPNNLIFGQIMMGYYTEMKDPKNVDKTEEELKEIVFKNLKKDPIYYTKNGQFGVKDLGYSDDASSLGEPKEPKGPHKSSGYGNLNEGVGKSYPDQIKGEYESKEFIYQGRDIHDYLIEMFELSNNFQDFLTKVTYGLTDETSELSKEDQQKLFSWYKVNTNKLNENKDLYDELANQEFGMDYDQLGTGEQEWVRDEANNLSENKNNTMDPQEKKLRKVIREMVINTFLKESKSKIKESERILNENKKAFATIKEIEKESQLVTVETKLATVERIIDEKTARLAAIDENEELKDLTDKKKIKELQREVKELEKYQKKLTKIYEKFTKGKDGGKKEIIDSNDGVSEAEGDVDDLDQMTAAAKDLKGELDAIAQTELFEIPEDND